MEGAVTQLLDICAPLFKRFISQCFLRVGLCSHTLFCCRTRGSIGAVRSKRKASIAWTRVHAIGHQRTCLIGGVSGCDRARISWHVETLEAFDHRLKWIRASLDDRDLSRSQWCVDSPGCIDLHRMVTLLPDFAIGEHGVDTRWSRDLHQTATTTRHRHLTLARHGTPWTVQYPSDERRQQMTVESKPRSRRDRDPIIARSGLWSSAITAPSIVESRLHLFQIHQTAWIEDWPRSWLTIAARSWPDRPTIGANSPPNRGWITVELEPRSMPKDPPPRRHQTAPTTASVAHDLRANFPLKNPCISPLFFNFWSICEGIKRIARKISSSSWSPRV